MLTVDMSRARKFLNAQDYAIVGGGALADAVLDTWAISLMRGSKISDREVAAICRWRGLSLADERDVRDALRRYRLRTIGGATRRPQNKKRLS